MSDPFFAKIEEDMMILCHNAYASGELLEKPLGSHDDMKFWIGITDWSNGKEMFTIPDQTYKEAQVLTFFDGHPHYSLRRSKRDNETSRRLTKMGYTVLRLQYRKNTAKVKRQFMKMIIETVNKKIEGCKING